MTLIKINNPKLSDDFLRLLKFYRQNPSIAASHILRRDGEPLMLMPIQQIILNEWWFNSINILTATRGAGKASGHGSKVLTSSGWVAIEDIKVGMEVITPNGNLSKVIQTHPQGKIRLFKVTFHDGRTCICSEDHLWKVRGLKCRNYYEIYHLKEIKNWLDNKAKVNHQYPRIPLVEGMFKNIEKKEVPIDPYVLGCLIGDGSYLTNSIIFTTNDNFLVKKIESKLPEDLVVVNYKKKIHYSIRSKIRGNRNTLRDSLKEIGCYGQRSWEKKIPKEYMNLNREQTLELIQGLIDTDGTVDYREIKDKGSRVSYTTTSKVLAKQIQQLIWKLGGICKISERVTSYKVRGEKRKGRKSYRLYIRYKNKRELVSLPRKLKHLPEEDQYSDGVSLTIKEIKEVEPDYATCITIDDPEGLYVTDDYIVTHNSFMSAVYIALKCLLYPSSMIGVFGPSFRQSKIVFTEFERLYHESPLLQECVAKAPTAANDRAYCNFKPAGNISKYSSLLALPVGVDGKKIRGNRFTEFFLDECVQLPQSIFRSVIRPMISTDINPAKSVRKLQELRKKYGDDIPDAAMDRNVNGYTVITSGYYQFNYWWDEIIKTWEAISKGSKEHSLRFVPWFDLPEGFLNMKVVEEARLNDPSHVFLTEWCADWISDSEGAFPMSLLEAARDPKVIPKVCRDKIADKDKTFIFGIDIARDRDSTAVAVVELGYPSKLVYLSEKEETPFPEQAKYILELYHRFQPSRIFIDAFGGGKTIQDYLEDPESVGMPSSLKIISTEESVMKSGKRILVMCNPSSEFIEDANNNAKTLLEQGAMKFPAATHSIEAVRKKAGKRNSEIDLVQEMINQIASIVVTPTATTGRLRYDLPKNKSSGGADIKLDAKKKDLYSAFILASYGAYEMSFKPREDKRMVTEGIVKEGVLFNQEPSIIDKRKDFPARYTISNKDMQNMNGTTRTVIPGGGIVVIKDGRK